MEKLKKFMNVWEIESNFKCPVAGAMLSVEKHKSILKKCGWDVSRLKPYEYHSTLMGCLGDENAVSIKVNNYIRHQSRKIMGRVAEVYETLDKGEARTKIRELWASWASQGDIGPAMYALVSHEDTDIELLRDIHGEVHMMAHANMTEVFDIRKKMAAVGNTLTREKERGAEKNGRIRHLVTENKRLASRLEQMEAECNKSQKKVAEIEGQANPDNTRILTDRIAALESELARARDRAVRAEQSEKKLQVELFSTRNENLLIRDEIQAMMASFVVSGPMDCPAGGPCSDTSCPNYTLCAKRIFMIGGITKMKSYYRDIVEKAGGSFDYHDGYMKNASDNLAAKVRRCDVVVCPVNCNSHNACLKVKKLCQRYKKELKILNSASLSALTQALMVPEDGDLTRELN